MGPMIATATSASVSAAACGVPPPIVPVRGPALHGNVVRYARQGIVIEGGGVDRAPVRVWDNDVAHSESNSWDGFIAALGVRLRCSAEPVGVHLTSDRSLTPSTSLVCWPGGVPAAARGGDVGTRTQPMRIGGRAIESLRPNLGRGPACPATGPAGRK